MLLTCGAAGAFYAEDGAQLGGFFDWTCEFSRSLHDTHGKIIGLSGGWDIIAPVWWFSRVPPLIVTANLFAEQDEQTYGAVIACSIEEINLDAPINEALYSRLKLRTLHPKLEFYKR